VDFIVKTPRLALKNGNSDARIDGGGSPEGLTRRLDGNSRKGISLYGTPRRPALWKSMGRQGLTDEKVV